MENRYLSQNSLPHAAVFGGVAQFLQSIMGPPETRPIRLWESFWPPSLGTGRKGRNSLRFGAESGDGFRYSTHGPDPKRAKTATRCRDQGGVRWREHSIENLPPVAVLPLEDLFDQPTAQTLSQLSDEPSMAALDALSADPTPILDALEAMAATNDRFLLLLI
jgi:hypothetical protein